ncbi:MAG TPA: hypothetical protein VKV02_14820, partial [Acidobacteriaceae bacterium]|nr:hypothetical protein [Acidobacteriaceae bacterium]
QTEVRNNIGLQSQEHPIVNLQLKVGDAGVTVEVNAAPPLVDQANASVGQVISTESVEDLPLNGRTPTTLTELSEGVITTAAPQIVHPFDNNAGNSWSIGGTPNQVSEVLLDGSPDLTLLGALAYAPTQDSVSEISVRPFDTDASFGHTIGGVINQVTKSGTNGLHGSIYEFSQVSALDADLYFNNRATPHVPTPVAHFNQYGLTVGGPVFVPKVFNGKDKLFFFFAFEKLKDSTPATTTLTVPTAAERNGDFSQTLAAGCPGGFANNPATAAAICLPSGSNKTNYADPNQLYNPLNATLNSKNQVVRQPILNNQLSSVAAVNPVAAAYFKLFPAPNNTTGAAATGQNNYISGAPSVDNYDNEFGRLDYNISARDHLFGDFRHNFRTQLKNDFFGTGVTGTTLERENFGLTIDNIFTLNSTTILDTRVNWTLFNEVHGTPAQAYSAASVGLPASLDAASKEQQLPCINFTSSTTIGSCGTSTTSYATLGDNTSAFDPTTNYQAFTDLVKIVGRHTLKVGFDGRQYRLSVQNFGNTEGTFNFGTSFVGSGPGNGNTTPSFGGDLASFYFGLPTAGALDNNTRADYHTYYIGSFLQDDYRVNDKLTVNLGVRFDIDTPYREKFGRTVNGFNPVAVNTASAGAAAAFKPVSVTTNGQAYGVSSINTLGGLTFPGVNDGAVFANNSGFVSPRLGFSLSVDPKSVLRGGFGIFVQPETLASLNAQGTYSSNALNNQEGFSATTSFVATNNNYLTAVNTLSNPFPSGLAQPAGSAAGASTFLGQSISFLAPVQHDPYSERWDLGFQRSVTSSTLVEALYVGNHSLHLPIASQNINATALQYLSRNPYRNQNLSTSYGTNVANPFAGLLPGSSFNGATVALGNLTSPYPQFGNAAVNEQNETIGQSYFHSLIFHVEQRAKHGLTLTANYSFSKLTEADTFLNDEDSAPTHRISPFDHTHHFTVGGTYDLPFGRGKALSFGGSRLMDEIFGGFVLNSIYQFQTGAPVEFSADIPLQPGANLHTITLQSRNTSPVPSSSSATGTPALSVNQFVTGSVTACPTTGPCDGSAFINGQYTFHYRTLPQTLSWVRGDGFNNLDASILKNFNFTEKRYLQLRFETFNTLNHPVFAAPNVSSATASNFGYVTAVYANSQPRQVQLGARIVF